LIVVLAKADIWGNLVGDLLNDEPFISGAPFSLDVARIKRTSNACRQLLLQTSSELVGAAEAFSQAVTYIPVSSLGTSPELVTQGDNKFYGIRPRNISPRWVTVPLLWALAEGVPGLIPTSAPTTKPGIRH
jgi:hypothetical protein